MKKTQCYETTDGELWKTKEAAETAQASIDLQKVLQDAGIDWTCTNDEEVCRVISQNFFITKK